MEAHADQRAVDALKCRSDSSRFTRGWAKAAARNFAAISPSEPIAVLREGDESTPAHRRSNRRIRPAVFIKAATCERSGSARRLGVSPPPPRGAEGASGV